MKHEFDKNRFDSKTNLLLTLIMSDKTLQIIKLCTRSDVITPVVELSNTVMLRDDAFGGIFITY